jgi:hypothetical protein
VLRGEEAVMKSKREKRWGGTKRKERDEKEQYKRRGKSRFMSQGQGC